MRWKPSSTLTFVPYADSEGDRQGRSHRANQWRSVRDWASFERSAYETAGSADTDIPRSSGCRAMAQFVLAFFVHVTERAKLTSAGWVVPPIKTYIRTYAWSEVVLTAVVVGIVVAVGFLLGRRRRGGEFGAGLLAWGLSIATFLSGIVGFSYLFGVAVFLCLACASVNRRPSTDLQRPSAMRKSSVS